ncbi:bifunctional tRNA (5-methylaminomethyl-2-thiouridine)(34)-methyltransferase MnmD/FAD-dependent 5-carboxymethylaminomethyl-2-thiouridine(34) oxidoreductase MnmC [Teredinibacter haidensis]|uniref:bifunctional tRNA (5-methylaminomethyl-2-thiouridine)(34)-methyltransferase MnmD/FAD-dependent 5-carboxymethylaminomethyl-2-thiouridine(34) oxidoreductase MnmC n=1 Tax=Teredinibacter haidensis TaxID=2731755 RepID=UPI000948ED6F|nr:bifunctional tRNA (5-methylaminomethyl-2-thiouridine)(34)-methyltransferase MnmD/FAD-dependent 5-carboxymethylaminomethyl-2-thiouridine(34) oxidoreductase MnmC [Teredinibacter haidensis]
MSDKTPPPPPTAKLQWVEQNQPFSTQFDDFYFSSTNGLEETQYVFIQHNALLERWQKPLQKNHFVIAETGFGTGLNFLTAWHSWNQCNPLTQGGQAARLHFISVEKYPLSIPDLQKALSLWPQLKDLSKELLEHYPAQPASACHRLTLDLGRITLSLYFGDATEGLRQFSPCSTKGQPCSKGYTFGQQPLVVDAWFLDGFTPTRNPDMWTPELFSTIAGLSNKGTSFSTFTSAGSVRRGLQDVGFTCFKSPGFGKKREMLAGTFVGLNNEQTNVPIPPKRGDTANHYWHLQNPAPADQSNNGVLIIGGGLAGCLTARALADRGVAVTLLEQNNQLALEASGNRQGMVYTRLSPHNNPLSRFNLTAQLFANHFYSRLFDKQSLFQLAGAQTGVLHLALSDKQEKHYRLLANIYEQSPDFCQWLNPQQASEISGIQQRFSGLWLPKSGWLSPRKLCKTLVAHPNINVQLGAQVERLTPNQHRWEAVDKFGKSLAIAASAVIANAHAARQLSQTAYLQLSSIRGQVTHIENSPDALNRLKTVLCGEGYIAPANDGIHCLGATFNLKDDNLNITQVDHSTNLDNLAKMVQFQTNDLCDLQLGGRVGFRTTTPDYFPVVGPVPNAKNMLIDFEKLRHRANAQIELPGSGHPGLYAILGLGSRGLAYGPLAAELLANLLLGEPLPIDQDLYTHLHPARFLIRDLIRDKTSTI